MRVRQGASALAKDLTENFSHFHNVSTNEDEQVVRFLSKEGDDILDQVARVVLDKGYGLREIAGKSKKLEDVFFQLTR